MEARLTFRDYPDPIKTEGGTRPRSPAAQWLQSRAKGGGEREVRPAVRQEKPLRRVMVPVP